MILGLLACVVGKDPINLDDSATPDGPVGGLHVSLAHIPTVLRVEWTTETASTGVVTARFDGKEIELVDAESGTEHSVIVTGIPPITAVDVTVSVTLEDGEIGEATADITTGSSPAWVPDFTFAADVPEQSEGGFTLAPVILALGGGVVALDDRGRAVWAWPDEDAGDAAAPFRARLSLDGTTVLYNHGATAIDAPAQLIRVALDGESVDTVEITGGHTDFVEYTPGGYLMLGWDLRIDGDRKILGDTIVEVAPDGTTRTIWNVFDHFEPDLSIQYGHFYVPDPQVEDWSHINGISYDPVDDAVYVTATFNNSVLRIDRASGALDWVLSDQTGDFDTSDGPLLQLPHSVQAIPDGVLVFNRGNVSDATSCSEAVDIQLNVSGGTAERVWQHEDSACLLVTFLGQADRLPGGNTMVTWSSSGQVDEVTPEGDVAWRVNAPLGSAIGFTGRVPTLGPVPE